MKKKYLISLFSILLIAGIYFFSEIYPFAKGVVNDTKDKTDINYCKDKELILFYNDYKNQISKITWIDEPPGKLSGLFLKINDKETVEIVLESIPKKEKFNFSRNWEIENVGKSIIHNITFLPKN